MKLCFTLAATLAAAGLVLNMTAETKPLTSFDLLSRNTYKDAKGHALPYRLLKPEGYDPKEKYPLVLFLHGAGERGTDNEKQLVHGVAEFLKPANRKTYPCFLLAPQCPEGAKWVEVDWSADTHKEPAKPSEPMRLTFELLAALRKEFHIDTHRIYITGLSMGGYGAYDALSRHPDLFAAAVPICGGADETKAERIAKIPIWIFHGADDTAVKPARSRNIVAALKKAGGHPKYTEYAGVGHNSWERAYKDPAMIKWLFEQKKP
jgi:predicted peptidase